MVSVPGAALAAFIASRKLQCVVLHVPSSTSLVEFTVKVVGVGVAVRGVAVVVAVGVGVPQMIWPSTALRTLSGEPRGSRMSGMPSEPRSSARSSGLVPSAMHSISKRTRTPSPDTLPPIWPTSRRTLPVSLGNVAGIISNPPGSMKELWSLALILRTASLNFRLSEKPDMPSLTLTSSTMMSISCVAPTGKAEVASRPDRSPPEPVGLPVGSMSTATCSTDPADPSLVPVSASVLDRAKTLTVTRTTATRASVATAAASGAIRER